MVKDLEGLGGAEGWWWWLASLDILGLVQRLLEGDKDRGGSASAQTPGPLTILEFVLLRLMGAEAEEEVLAVWFGLGVS